LLFLATALLVSGVILSATLWRTAPDPTPMRATTIRSQQVEPRRMSGPFEDSDDWKRGNTVFHQLATNRAAPPDPDVGAPAGEWLFRLGSAEEWKPIRTCANCVQLQ
jgi:hypothetical protein